MTSKKRSPGGPSAGPTKSTRSKRTKKRNGGKFKSSERVTKAMAKRRSGPTAKKRNSTKSSAVKHLRDEGISASLQAKAKIEIVPGYFDMPDRIKFRFFDKNKREVKTNNGKPFVRDRLQGETVDGRKYTQEKGTGNHAYLSLVTDWTKITDFDICEGEKDSLLCCAKNMPTAGICGHSSYKDADGLLVPELLSLLGKNPKGKLIVLIPDNDYHTNHQVENGWNGFALKLIDLRADVWFRWLPPGPAKGAGDFIRIHGVAAYKKLPIERADKDKLIVDNNRHLTDVGNAYRFVDHIQDRVIYTPELGAWYFFDDIFWLLDTTRRRIQEAKATIAKIYKEAANEEKEERRKKIAAHATKSENEQRLNAMISLARSDPRIVISQGRLDRNPYLLCVRNGVLNLQTGKLIQASPDQYITRQAPVTFDRSARADHWLEFLKKICAGNQLKIAYLHRAIGYTLTGCTGEQVLFFLHGNGQNGKSVFIETIAHILGDYSASAPSTMLMKTHNESIPNDVARLRGCRMATLSELDIGDRFNEARIKLYTGSDTIPARFLHQEWFEFEPDFKMWIHGNHKPVIRGQDKGIWRRIVLIPFDFEIPDDERVLDFAKNYLYPEASGILNWAVKGCLEWHAKGLAAPPVIKAQTALYRDESDILGDFIAECCDVGPKFAATTAQLYEAYTTFCEDRNERPMTSNMFGRLLGERFERLGTKRPRLYAGIRVH